MVIPGQPGLHKRPCLDTQASKHRLRKFAEVQRQFSLHNEFQASQNYLVRSCFKNNNKRMQSLRGQGQGEGGQPNLHCFERKCSFAGLPVAHLGLRMGLDSSSWQVP